MKVNLNRNTSPRPNDSVAPAHSALRGPSPGANSFRRFPSGSSPQRGEGGRRKNSRNKGKVGEREFAALLRAEGFDGRRGQQFSGGAESPDVVSEALAWLHFEIKRVEKLNLIDACAQAEGDSQGKPWVVVHRRNHAPWLITMRAEFFFQLIREFQPRMNTDGHGRPAESGQVGKGESEKGSQDIAANQRISAAADAAAINQNKPNTDRTHEN